MEAISTETGFYSTSPHHSLLSYREDHRLQDCRPEEAEGPRPEEDPQRLGGELRRLPGEGRLHQEDRGAQAKVRQRRAISEEKGKNCHHNLRTAYC